MTKTFEELEAKVDKLAARYRELETLLIGDVELREKYEAGKPNYPNIPEPPRGMLDRLDDSIAKLTLAIEVISREAASKREELRQLRAFLAPVMDGKNPPIDGAQIATKAFVDDGIARIARVIRDEIDQIRRTVEPAVEFVKNLTNHLTGTKGFSGALAIEFAQVWARDQMRQEAEEREKNRPSRIASLIYAVTGHERANGARR